MGNLSKKILKRCLNDLDILDYSKKLPFFKFFEKAKHLNAN